MVASDLMQTDLSVWGMYQHADIVVKIVMIGLLLASVVTWAIFFGKYAELSAAKRRLKKEHQALGEARSLADAYRTAEAFKASSHSALLLADAREELALSAGTEDLAGIKERTSFRLERRVGAFGRHAGRGNGFLATIGSVAPFIGLFGTVWGIMEALKGISAAGSASLETVAGPIGSALIATGVGIAVAVPAVLVYNYFLRRLKLTAADLDDFAHDFYSLAQKSAFRVIVHPSAARQAGNPSRNVKEAS